MATTEWFERIRQGDLEAFNRLVSENQDQVYRLAYYLLCNEPAAARLTEVTFQRAFREVRSYRGGPARLWLYSLVVRAYLHEIATRKSHPANPVSASKIVNAREQAVQKSLAALPPEQRLALALVDVEGLDYPQAASIAGWPVSTVSSRLAQARHTFANHISQQTISA
jgi:RNA polymerase sigma-70 factor (ECF subfamily)